MGKSKDTITKMMLLMYLEIRTSFKATVVSRIYEYCTLLLTTQIPREFKPRPVSSEHFNLSDCHFLQGRIPIQQTDHLARILNVKL